MFTPQLVKFFCTINCENHDLQNYKRLLDEEVKRKGKRLRLQSQEFEKWSKSNHKKSPEGTKLEFMTEIKLEDGKRIPMIPCNGCFKGIPIAGGIMANVAE